MSPVLLRSSAFVRDARRLLRRRADLAEPMLLALRQLEADPSLPALKTHKLKGKLKDSWACSVGYDVRIVFSYTKYRGKSAILLETVGTHDEVY